MVYEDGTKGPLVEIEESTQSRNLEKVLEDGYRGLSGKNYTSLAAAMAAGDIKIPSYVDELGSKFEEALSDNAKWTFKQKYLYRNDEGDVQESPRLAIYRMARSMAEVELQYGKSQIEVEKITQELSNILYKRNFAPAGRAWTNMGTEVRGLFNCYVLPIKDDLEEIFESVKDAAIIHKNGGGTGYNFSSLRPRGTYVKKSKGVASGPVSFITQFDRETEIINSGNRRGANMGILDIDHPDILDFIYAKHMKEQITNFNVSVGATDNFMNAVKNREFYTLRFQGEALTKSKLEKMIENIEENKLGASDVGVEPEPISLAIAENGKGVIDSYTKKIAGRVNDKGEIQLNANYVFDLIAELAWKTADPGMIFLDTVNKTNPLPRLGDIRATNPCGEQPLHSYDACNLGSANLERMVKEGTDESVIDYETLGYTVKKMVRFMDNVNDANKGPIPEVEETVKKHRRIGLGMMGLADLLVQLYIPYGSEKGRKIAGEVAKFITDKAKEASVELAIEKGVFPSFEGSKYDTGKPEDRVRNVDRTTIAPTGTIAMLYDVGSGIEPFFALGYKKHIRGGEVLNYVNEHFIKVAKKRGFYSEALIEKIVKNGGILKGIDGVPEDVKEVFKTAQELSIEDHVKMQAVVQEYTDNAVSKTINMFKDVTVDDVKKSYMLAWETGCKGTTIYRDGSKKKQVLSTHKENEELNKFSVNAEGLIETPEILPGFRIRQSTPFGNMHTFVAYNPSDHKLQEIFGLLGRAGEVAQSDMEGMGRLASIGFRSGLSIETILKQLSGIGSRLSMPAKDGAAISIPDAMGKVLQKYKLMKDEGLIESAVTGKINLAELANDLAKVIKEGNGETVSAKIQNRHFKEKCLEPGCEGTLTHESGCTLCRSCGFSKC